MSIELPASVHGDYGLPRYVFVAPDTDHRIGVANDAVGDFAVPHDLRLYRPVFVRVQHRPLCRDHVNDGDFAREFGCSRTRRARELLVFFGSFVAVFVETAAALGVKLPNISFRRYPPD